MKEAVRMMHFEEGLTKEQEKTLNTLLSRAMEVGTFKVVLEHEIGWCEGMIDLLKDRIKYVKERIEQVDIDQQSVKYEQDRVVEEIRKQEKKNKKGKKK